MLVKMTAIEKRILQEVKKAPLTITELKRILFGIPPPDEDFYWGLNYLIVYRDIIKFNQQGKRDIIVFRNTTT